MGEDMLRIALIAVAGLALACQGPPATTLHSVQPTERPVVRLAQSLAPLADAFDAKADMPRVVALLPTRCDRCGQGLAALERSVLQAYPRERLHVFVVLPLGERCEACGAAAQRGTEDARLTFFCDAEGVASRAFARGLLPLARAQDVYLLYPAGVRWPRQGSPTVEPSKSQAFGVEPEGPAGSGGGPPRAEEWWHRLGRVAPERHCTDLELEGTLRAAVGRLVRGEAGAARVPVDSSPAAPEPAWVGGDPASERPVFRSAVVQQ
jgi:hypothetical protein